MRSRTRPLAALAALATLLLAGCGGDDDGDGGAPTTIAAEPGDGMAAPGSGDEGTWLLGGQPMVPDVLSCTVISNPDGETLEVVAQGALSSGSGYSQLRLVDSPPDLGDASIRIVVEDEEYREDLEPSGGTTGELDDLFWEVDDTGTFVLLGSFPVAGAEVDIDLEVGCERF